MPEPVVFLGPSLPRAHAERLLPHADFRPPIRRGDLAALDRPSAVAIIDGEFFQSLAVSPKEILPLLKRGIPIFGSSSMGALRAVELSGHGMVGIGRIFDLFYRGALRADDEVAMTFSPESLRATSEPLVNLRLGLVEAHRCGLLTLAELIRLTRPLKAAHFPERTARLLFHLAAELLPKEKAAALRAFWTSRKPDQKAEDAAALLLQLAAR